jgi:hypothetical protein
LKKGEKFV